jgi:pSer/pThr/pTyr-binding forkhead associated (FHA) protein
MRSWLIGSAPDCDLVVASPTVSGHHCRLGRLPDGYLLEDLGSTNGTYVNGTRLSGQARITRGDAVTLGLTTPMPWPEPGTAHSTRTIRIGRAPDNDVCLDDPRVSSYHARIVVTGGQALLEDLGSSNGTYLGSFDRRITRAPLAEADLVFFGSYSITARDLLAAPGQPAHVATDPVPEPVQPGSAAERTSPQHASPFGPRQAATAALLLAVAPALAALIALAWGGRASAQVTPENWPAVAGAVAATVFALGLAALWFGASAAVGGLVDRASDRPGEAVWAWLVPAALALVQCALLLAIVHAASGLRGPWWAEFGWLVLASAVGVALGRVVASIVPCARVMSLAALGLIFLPMILLGGPLLPLPRLGLAPRLVADVLPSRWAFEGLLLLESDRRPTRLPTASADAIEPAASNPSDMAERYFPAVSERMGPLAVFLALAATLAGLLGLSALVGADRPITSRKLRSPELKAFARSA